MSIVINHARTRLEAGALALGMGLRQARTVDTAQIARTAGFDWLFIDCEHNSMSIDVAAQIASAALAIGVTPLVRVPSEQHWMASRLLDNGAQGIVAPHVDTAEAAARLVSHCRFPPVGHRSMGGGLQQLGFETLPIDQACEAVDRHTLLVVMIESPQGVANCDEIAAVPGIDVLLIGTTDLSMEMGIPGQFEHPRIVQAYEKVIAACHRHGKYPGMGGMYTAPLFEKYVGLGARFILAGSDFAFLMQAARDRVALLRGIEPRA
ncbi:MAG: aldolase/citrate lyase family protein [Burkholderiaceae bacterium]